MFEDNAARRRALGLIKGLAAHVEQCGKTWQRRLEAETNSERRKRERQDVIAVPDLSDGSKTLLRELDGLPSSEKSRPVGELAMTPEGRRALDEAKEVVSAIEKRFGRANPADLAEQLKRAGSGQVVTSSVSAMSRGLPTAAIAPSLPSGWS
ncbi:hypothetical protein FHT78_005019 [Rhizobium sp. BK196]|nr:hypothetical protein [Rhizobium sp. BK196]MBB3464344.1 hypothetical protein [Rhizobium sp. BK377]